MVKATMAPGGRSFPKHYRRHGCRRRLIAVGTYPWVALFQWTHTAKIAALMLVAASLGCAARSASISAAERNRADALVADGCYDCLLEARDIYAAAGAGRGSAVALRLFEVELLIALREKELAIDTAGTIERARALAAQAAAPFAGASRVVDIVAAVPDDATGRLTLPPPTAVLRAQFDESLATIATSPLSPLVKRYVTLTLQCGRVAVTPEPADGSTPLLSYRLAICDNPIETEPLRAARMAVPRFVETSFYLGRAAIRSLPGTDGREARELLEEAYARFASSPAVAFALGTVYQATGDCRRAEELFSSTLSLRPGHADARLGRAICRTYLARPQDAIADASVLVDTGAYNRAEAYYWRAWNHRYLKQLTEARSDIDASRRLLYNARVLTLAGMIEHDQREFDTAREDLTRARDMDSTECQARWYLGLVGYGTERWAESASAFADAAECYDRAVALAEQQREAMAKRDDVSEEFRARQLAGFDAAIAEDRSQKSAADLNAAINYARAQDVERATIYMKRAAVDPERRSVVEDLRQVLGVPRW
jgi:tetratricopeptide (TPR) repeat protein